MTEVRVGDRIRIVDVLPEDPSPPPIGAEGTVERVTPYQIWVRWDPKVQRSLLLLPGDPFEVIDRSQ